MTPKKPTTQDIMNAIDTLRGDVAVLTEVLVTGDPKHDQPGALERLRKVEAWQKAEKYFILAMGMLIASDLAMRLWGVMTAAPPP